MIGKKSSIKSVTAVDAVELTRRLEEDRVPYKLKVSEVKYERYDIIVDVRDETITVKKLAQIVAERKKYETVCKV